MSYSDPLSQRPSRNSARCATYKTNRDIKIGKLNKSTQLRIRYYELKIQVSDFCERIANSINTNWLHKTSISRDVRARGNTRNQKHSYYPYYRGSRDKRKCSPNNSSRPRHGKGSNNEIHKHKRKSFSDRERTSIRRTISKRSVSVDSFGRGKKHYFDEFKESTRTRKQRSSLTKRKSVDADDHEDVSYNSSLRKKNTRNDCSTSHGDYRKSSSASSLQEKRRIRKNREKISMNKHQTRKSCSSSPNCNSSLSAPESKNDEKIDSVKKLEESTNQEDQDCAGTKEPTVVTPAPPQVTLPYNALGCDHDHKAMNAAKVKKGMWKRLGLIILANRQRRKSIDSLPPKLIKFGLQLNPLGEKIRKAEMDTNTVQFDLAYSQDAPSHQERFPYTHYPLSKSKFDQPIFNTLNTLDHFGTSKAKTKKNEPSLDTNVSKYGDITLHFRTLVNKLQNLKPSSSISTTAPNTTPTSTATNKYSMDFDPLNPLVSKAPNSSDINNIYSSRNFASNHTSPNTEQDNSLTSLLPKLFEKNGMKSHADYNVTPESGQLSNVQTTVAAALKTYTPQTAFTAQYKHLLASN